MRGGTRKPVTFRFDCDLLERARRQADADNRTLTNYVETAVLRAIERSDGKPSGTNEIIGQPSREDIRK
jgi:hypothetical protein